MNTYSLDIIINVLIYYNMVNFQKKIEIGEKEFSNYFDSNNIINKIKKFKLKYPDKNLLTYSKKIILKSRIPYELLKNISILDNDELIYIDNYQFNKINQVWKYIKKKYSDNFTNDYLTNLISNNYKLTFNQNFLINIY